MIVGVGIDIVGIARFRHHAEQTPDLLSRVFHEDELAGWRTLAARFAMKEAAAKALGVPVGADWHDFRLSTADDDRPELVLAGRSREAAAALGVTRWHLSISHDAGTAIALAVAERETDAPAAYDEKAFVPTERP